MATAPDSLLDRLIRWSRRHVLLVDAWWAVVWTGLALLGQPVVDTTEQEDLIWALVVLTVGAALVIRRTRPRLSIGTLALTMALHVMVLPIYTAVSVIGTCAAAYTAHALLARRDRFLVTVALAVGTAWAAFAYPRDLVDLPWFMRWPVVLVQWLFVAVFCLIGALTRKRREELANAVERAELIETQQAQELRLATLGERTHIAREMHDIVAHSLGVIIAQADGGRYAAGDDPAAATRSLETISAVGRESLAEMRQLLTVLRSDDQRDLVPAPSLNNLHDLIEDYRKAGVDARLVVHGSATSLSDTTALTVYRIVQESLANVLKHAGRATAKVTLDWSADHISVEIANALPTTPPDDNPGGHGLVGMRERVGLHGGTMTAGPEGGVWRVHAVIPLRVPGTRVADRRSVSR